MSTENGNSTFDLAYMLESADSRLANACPFTEDVKPPAPVVVPTFTCERCGGTFVKKCRGVQKYCAPCAVIREKERILERKKRGYVKPENERKQIPPAETLSRLAEAARLYGVRLSGTAHTGSTEHEIEKASRLADAEGISYGKYMAMRRR